MDETLKKQLEITACKVRLGILEGVFNAKSGHPGGSLSIADLLTYLYFAKMNVYPDKPEEPERDRLVLSKGHTAPALYATLAEKGFFPKEELKSLRHIGAMLQGHPCISYKAYRHVMRFPGTGQFQPHAVWHWLESLTVNLIRFILYWETVKSKKVRYGRLQCLRHIKILIIL